MPFQYGLWGGGVQQGMNRLKSRIDHRLNYKSFANYMNFEFHDKARQREINKSQIKKI